MGGRHRYGVILDAGSSGSRVYVYQWLTPEAAKAKYSDKSESEQKKKLDRLPRLKTHKDWRLKVKPGISTFNDSPERVGPDHLHDLVQKALDVVPAEEVSRTPIFLLATAGMRLVEEQQRADILKQTCAYFREKSDFLLPDCDLHVQVIPGETEGLYGWIAANYLLGGFDSPEKHDHGKDGHHTYGFLDMGGASAQIAFAPNSTEAETHANDLKLLKMRKINGANLDYKVFVTTWLGFGANEARRRYVEALLESYPDSHETPDPCLPVGLRLDVNGHEVTGGGAKGAYLLGTGDFTGCLKATVPLLEKDKHCADAPCLLNGVHTPAIDFHVNHFVGVSEYWHTTHEVFAMAHKDKAYDFPTYQKQVSELCSRKWSDIENDVKKQKWGKKVDKHTIEEVCFKASWLISMLHDGIGVPRQGIDVPTPGDENKTDDLVDNAKDRGFLDPFQAVDKIDGTEVSWTLGKMVLYASSQMPGAGDDKTLAVGFGSNDPASTKLPSDFQFAGGKYEPSPLSPADLAASDDDAHDDWHDRILSSNYSRRAPGFLIFLLILVLAAYLLCGRDRRQTLQRKLSSLLGGKRGSSSPKFRRRKAPGLLNIFSANNGDSSSYARVLEDGVDPDEFELSDVESLNGNSRSYSDNNLAMDPPPSRNGRTSGWATPLTRGLSPDISKYSPRGKGYFDSSGGQSGADSALTPFERGGLTVRTESKERLAAPVLARPGSREGGKRSRAGSPTRRSPLIAGFKESVE